jgi:energy-coupling factor transporter ATP-binding protein EcfA2
MKEHSLFVEKFRPNTLENYVGNEHLKTTISKYIEQNDIQNLIFYGQPGGGKTTLAKLIAQNLDCDYIYINASDERGIDTIRDKVLGFASTASFKPIKIVVLDECLEENTLVTVLRRGKIQQIPIKDLDEKNDLVKSYNIEKNKIEWKPFYLWDKGEQETYEIEFENGEIIVCTPDHKWYVKDDKGQPKIVKTIELENYMEIFNPKS